MRQRCAGKQHFGLPFLGMVPALFDKAIQNPLINNGVPPTSRKASEPCVHTVFGKAQHPGLSNVLVGNAKASESVHKTTVPGLWVMPAGPHPPNPAELLGSKRFKDFIASLAEHFDRMIIDTPPVMAVTDSSVVAHAVTGVLFVIGAEMTSRHAAGAALDQLSAAKARFVGAVLNRVDLQHHGLLLLAVLPA